MWANNKLTQCLSISTAYALKEKYSIFWRYVLLHSCTEWDGKTDSSFMCVLQIWSYCQKLFSLALQTASLALSKVIKFTKGVADITQGSQPTSGLRKSLLPAEKYQSTHPTMNLQCAFFSQLDFCFELNKWASTHWSVKDQPCFLFLSLR